MTRYELLQLLIGQARANGFEFRRWYVGKLHLPWTSSKDAIEMLAAERRYYALLFSHEFASKFWKAGEKITFQIPQQTFQRKKADGTIGTVVRKGYTRRSAREDVMAVSPARDGCGGGAAAIYETVSAGGRRDGTGSARRRPFRRAT